jgi:hypothetical protein
MPQAEKHIFQKINTDLEDRLMQSTMYRSLLNGVVAASDSNNMGAVENAVGNRLLENAGISGATVLKSFTDPESNTIIYFVSDSTIWRFNPESEVFEKVLGWSGLDFGTINGVDVLDGSLVWSDKNNEYRKINIEKAISGEYTKDTIYTLDSVFPSGSYAAFALSSIHGDVTLKFPKGESIIVDVTSGTQPSGTHAVTYSVFNVFQQRTHIYTEAAYVGDGSGTATPLSTLSIKEEDITLLRRAPRYPLGVEKTQDDTFAQNLLQRNSFQFTYRYIYWDNEKSRFAPMSRIVLVEPNDNATIFDNNNIICRIPTSEEIRVSVKSIEWVFRVDNTNEFAIFDVTGPSARSVNFKNDVAGATIADAEVVVSFDDVPRNGSGLKAVQNRVFTNNFTTGYEATPLTINATVDETGGTNYPDQQIYMRKVTERAFAIIGVGEIISTTNDNGWWQNSAGNWFKVDIVAGSGGLSGSTATYNAYIRGGQGDGIPDGEIAYEEIGGEGGFNTITYHYPEPQVLWLPPPIGPINIKATVYTEPRENVTMFKAGDTYQVGVRFSDNLGRNIGVSTSKSGRVQMPEFVDPENMTLNYGQINWELPNDFEIPIWATHYEVVRTRNLSRSFFLQGQSIVMAFGKRDESSDGSTLLTLEGINKPNYDLYFNISNSTRYKIGYVFSEGDRMKFWYNNGGPYDAKILGQDGPWLIVDNPLDPTVLPSASFGNFYEIYTPYLGSLDESFFEIGLKYPINNPGESDRSFSVNSGQLIGDIYRKTRKIYGLDFDTYALDAEPRVVNMSETFTEETFEAMNPNDDYYEQWVSDIGRQTIVVPEARQQEKKYTLKYGGNYAVDALVNNISTWNPGDEYPMPLENGPATALAATNNNLLYFHEREVSAIYINEGFMSTQDGGEQLIRMVETVSDDRKLRLGHGCINPESIAEYADKVWWWDMHKGAACRYSNEGVVALSDDGMLNYFYQLSRKLLPYKDSSKVYGIYDPYLDYYILTFAPVSQIGYEGETFAFSERSKGGVGWFSFKPEQYATANKTLYSFKDGQLWKHDDRGNCNKFYGTKYDRVIKFTGGQQDQLKVKIWANFRIDAESVAVSMDAADQTITLTAGTQEGRVYTHQIENREGVFIGAFRQNVNTPVTGNIEADPVVIGAGVYNVESSVPAIFNERTLIPLPTEVTKASGQVTSGTLQFNSNGTLFNIYNLTYLQGSANYIGLDSSYGDLRNLLQGTVILSDVRLSLGPTSTQNYMMYNGDVIRSQVCDVEIKNDRTDLSPLYFVTLLYRISEASFK